MNFNEEMSSRVSRLEEAMSTLQKVSITKDKLEAELLKAKLDGIREGRDAAIRYIGLLLAGLSVIVAALGIWLKFG